MTVLAFTVRDHRGKLLLLSTSMAICNTPFFAVLKFLYWASEYAASCSWQKVMWVSDAQNVINDILDTKEPSGWESARGTTTIRHRFRTHEWRLVWEGKEYNELADSRTKYTALNEISFFFDEFSLGNLSQVCLDVVLTEQLRAGFFEE